MERTKHLYIALFCFFTLILCGQNKPTIYNAFISGDMLAWKQEIDRMEEEPVKCDSCTLELVNYQIGYIGWCIGVHHYDEAKSYLKLAKSHLEKLADSAYKPSYVQAYMGSVNGLLIGLNHFYAIFLGPDIVSKAESSIKQNSNNPYGYILLGNSKYYMWAMMGGSKEKAIVYYKKAEAIMENEKNAQQNWNYLSLLTMIAHAYVEMGMYSNAHLYYEKILGVEPNYKWIRDEIYPSFLKAYENR